LRRNKINVRLLISRASESDCRFPPRRYLQSPTGGKPEKVRIGLVPT